MLDNPENPYLNQIKQTLPRLLALIDTDQTSDSHGLGDRFFWAWGLIDFGNGSFQGAAHGLARLWSAGLWPYATHAEHFLQRIDSLFRGAKVLTRKDGSLEEAFPCEGSYCVTALVAFDLLCAFDLLKDEIDGNRQADWLRIIQPMIGYLIKADETHAFISNHLATAVAALTRWHRVTQSLEAENRARQLLDRILSEQSSEGWFREYEGADPGYQSLCTYYLADVYQVRPDWNLIEPLRRSLQFLWYFAHPDGSFGGLYGSRCTRFYYPAGILLLAEEIREAKVLSAHMATSIASYKVVTLMVMDESNLIPMFNAYCWAAALAHSVPCVPASCDSSLPAKTTVEFRKHFPLAGLFVDRGACHYTVVSTHKGGVVAHFSESKPPFFNAGVVVSDPKGALGSSQVFSAGAKVRCDGGTLVIEGIIVPMPKRLPGPTQFIALRVLCVTLFRFSWLREQVKKQLVRLLITASRPWPVVNCRTIKLGADLSISDEMDLPRGYSKLNHVNKFVPIHMASQGYWQCQDEECSQ